MLTSDSDVSLEYIGNTHTRSDDQSHLLQANKKLREDYDSLKVQFDEAVRVSEQIDSLCDQNTSLSNKNRKLQSQVDELQRRLDISLQLNDELNEKMKQEKEANEAFMNSEVESLHQQIKLQEKKFTEKLAHSSQELADAQAAARSLEKDKKDKELVTKELLQVASQKFATRLSSLHSFVAFLEHLPKEQPAPETPKVDADAVVLENGKLRKKAKQMKAALKSLETEVQRLKQENATAKKESQAEVAKATEMVNDVKRQKNLLEAEKDQVIEQLQREKKALEDQIAKDKQKIGDLTSRIQASLMKAEETAPQAEEVELLNNRIGTLSGELKKASRHNKQMKKRVAALIEEARSAEEVQEKLKKAVSSLKAKNEELKVQLGESNAANSALLDESQRFKAMIDAASKEQESLTQKLARAKSRIASTQAETQKLRRTVTSLDENLNEQKSRVGELMKANQQQLKVIGEREATIKDQNDQIEALTGQVKTLKSKTAGQNQKAAKSGDSEIPQSCWFCIDFPKDLGSAVAEIGKMESLNTPSKIRQTFVTVAKYYAAAIGKLEKRVKEAQSNTEQVNGILKHLVDIVNAHIGTPEFQYEAFVTGVSLDEIEFKLNEVRENMEQLYDEKTRMADGIHAISQKLGATSIDSALAKLVSLLEAMQKQATQIKQLQVHNKQLKMAHNRMLAEVKQLQCEHDKDLEVKDKEINDIITTKNEQIQATELSKLRIASLEQEIERMQQRQEQMIKELEEDAAERLEITTCELTSKHNNEILGIQQSSGKAIAAVKQDLANAQKKITKLKRRIDALVNAKSDLEKQIKATNDESQEALQSMKQHFSVELTQTNQKHKSETEALEAAIAEKDDQIGQLTNTLRTSNEQMKKLLDANRDLESDKQQLESKIASQRDEINREKRLSETKLKTFTVTTDLKLRDSIDSVAAKFEREKRDIYHFGADLFKQFFDPRRQLTDESYKVMLQAAKNELSRMQKQEMCIRRMLGAGNGESAESAIARNLARNTEE